MKKNTQISYGTCEILLSVSRKISVISVFLLLLFSFGSSVEAQTDGNACNGIELSGASVFPLSSYDISMLKTADVNNDGIKDVLTSLPTRNKIAVQTSNGEGGISSTVEFDAGTNPTKFDLADFNRDGETDIVVINRSINMVSILLGDGNGGFSFLQSYDFGTNLNFVSVGNFNGDQYPDIVVSRFTSVKVFTGNRDLTFSELNELIIPSFDVETFALADFNGDGATDIATGLYSYSASSWEVRVYIRQSGGNFTQTASFPGVRSTILSVGDFDNNGITDLLADQQQGFPRKFFAYKGNGDGTFQNAIVTNASNNYAGVLFDFNIDGNLDIVTNNGSVYLGNGTGNFTIYVNSGLSSSTSSVGFGDFNSDGFPDVAIATAGASTSILLNGGSGSIPEISQIGKTYFTQVNRPQEVKTADFNGDGRKDFVTTSAYNNRAFVFLQDEQGGFVPTPEIGLPMGGGFNVSSYSVTVADFNGDSIPDFAATDSYLGEVVVFRNNGDGTFVSTRVDLSTMFQITPQFIRTGDFNNDNKIDIIVTNNRNYNILLNDGNGGFTVLQGGEINPDSGKSIVEIGDITNDGILDLVVARTSQGAMIYLTGNGDGTFVRRPVPINGVGNIGGVILKDLNSDGNLDLIVGGNGNMVVQFGVGNGGFFYPVLYSFEGSIRDLSLVDFDQDGIADVVAAGGPMNSITFFKGTGNGVFNQAVAYNSGTQAYYMAPEDFNGDGKLDFVISTGTFVITVVYNKSNFLLPCLSVGDTQIIEGNSGTSNVGFNVSLSAPSANPVTVNYKTVGRTADSNSDFTQASGTLTFQPGITTQTVNLTINGDVLDEDNETFTLTLSNASGAKIVDGIGVAEITDDDAAPDISIGDVSVIEGNSGIRQVLLPVSLSGASGRKVKVKISTQDATATANQDYQPFTETLFFAAGSTSKTVAASIISDTLVEPDEYFNVNLTEPTNINVADGQATVTILNDDVQKPFDFDGDGKSDISVFRPSNGAWYVQQSQNGFFGVIFGFNSDLLAPADFDGDGRTDISVFRPSNGGWYRLNSFDNTFTGVIFGQNGDIPRPADFDGDGKADINVFRPSNGSWYRLNSSNGAFYGVAFGQNGDQPLIADFDGDGKSDIAVFRPNTGSFYSLDSSTVAFRSVAFGFGTDIPTPGDFDGDGKTDVAVFRPSNGSWYRLNSSDGTFFGVAFGSNSDIPVTGDYDGDGKADIAVFRNGNWYRLNSSSGGFYGELFGLGTDRPIPSAFR